MAGTDDQALPSPHRRDAATPAVRASDAERDATIATLRDAAAEGRLTLEELADRVEAATAARHRADLELITRDLPVGPHRETDVVVARTQTRSVFGDVKRSGTWLVPASSRWGSFFGDIVLDLREATVSSDEVTLEAMTVFGDIQILVPEGVVVELQARTLLGDVKQEAGLSAPSGAPRVVVTGSTVFGDVKVRARRLRERLAERLSAGRA